MQVVDYVVRRCTETARGVHPNSPYTYVHRVDVLITATSLLLDFDALFSDYNGIAMAVKNRRRSALWRSKCVRRYVNGVCETVVLEVLWRALLVSSHEDLVMTLDGLNSTTARCKNHESRRLEVPVPCNHSCPKSFGQNVIHAETGGSEK